MLLVKNANNLLDLGQLLQHIITKGRREYFFKYFLCQRRIYISRFLGTYLRNAISVFEKQYRSQSLKYKKNTY